MSKGNALVTGGAGFVGSELVRQLLERGWRVTIIDNLVNGRRDNVADVLSESCQLVTADIRDVPRIIPHLADVDVLFHLACLGVRHSIHNPEENHAVNATGTLTLLSAARARGVARFVYVSSSEVYGTARRVPMKETHPTFPLTVYGASKLAAECYTRAFFETYGYSTVIVRPFNAYGPRSHHEGDSGEVIPKFVLRSLADRPLVIFGDGWQTRDFSFVSDTARGILLAGLSHEAVGQTVNIGSGQEISINELAQTVIQVVGRPRPRVIYEDPRPGDVLKLCADVSRARDLVGFEPTIELRQGLARLLDWYFKSGKSAAELLEAERVRNWEPAEA